VGASGCPYVILGGFPHSGVMEGVGGTLGKRWFTGPKLGHFPYRYTLYSEGLSGDFGDL
jgi:hypothetical protein